MKFKLFILLALSLQTLFTQNLEWVTPKPGGVFFDIFAYDEHLMFVRSIDSHILKSTDQGESWEAMYVPFSGNIFAMDQQTYFGIQDAYDRLDAPLFFRSTNGGDTWVPVLNDTASWGVPFGSWVVSFDKVDDAVAWCIIEHPIDGSHEYFSLFKTEDGSENWVKQHEFENHHYKYNDFVVKFLNRHIGYVSSPQSVYQTTDGGESFIHRQDLPGFAYKNAMMKTQNYLLGWNDKDNPKLFFTRDTVWQQTEMPTFAKALWVRDDSIWISPQSYKEYVYKSTFPDVVGWQKIQYHPIAAIKYFPDTEMFLRTASPTEGEQALAKKYGNGQWTPLVTTPLDGEVFDYFCRPYFINEDEYFMPQYFVTSDQMGAGLLYSSNGGMHWDKINSNGYMEIETSLVLVTHTNFALDSQNIWTLLRFNGSNDPNDDYYLIDHTTDGGVSWERTKFDEYGIQDWFFLDASTGFILSLDPNDQLSLYQTSDGGTTWAKNQTIELEPENEKHSYTAGARAFVYNNGRLFVNPLDAYLYFTDDLGKSWTKQNRDFPGDISFYNDKDGYMITYDQQLLKTSTNGETWESVVSLDLFYKSINTAPLIRFIDQSEGYLINASNMEVYYTRDRGTSWQKVCDFQVKYFGLSLFGDELFIGSNLGIFKIKQGQISSLENYPSNRSVPESFSLLNNYPNPFNPETRIEYHLPEAAEVSLTVYDITGADVRELHSGWMPAGAHLALWDGRTSSGAEAASGVYFCRMTAKAGQGTNPEFVKTIKLLLQK